jgi:putative FmdB family regulatory protein
MPIYEYRCERGHTFEVMQRMTDDPLSVCDEHGTPVQRVFHPVAVHFKGSGFYNTDYGKKKSGAASGSSEGSSSEGSSSDSSSGSDSSASKSGSSGPGSKNADSSSTKSSSSSE